MTGECRSDESEDDTGESEETAGGNERERESPEALARAYYRALDDGAYDRLAALLAPEFAHERPDRTLTGRDRFVGFMREERPRTATSHPLDAVYRPVDSGVGDGTEEDGRAGTEVAVRGRLVTDDGDRLARFVDVFTVADGRFRRLRTYTA